jgi:hypothetical protein
MNRKTAVALTLAILMPLGLMVLFLSIKQLSSIEDATYEAAAILLALLFSVCGLMMQSMALSFNSYEAGTDQVVRRALILIIMNIGGLIGGAVLFGNPLGAALMISVLLISAGIAAEID